METLSKELKILKSLTTSEYFNKIDELLEAKCESFILKEESVCSRC